MFADPGLLLACGFGTGLLPRAPGTFGTLAAVPLYLLLSGLALGAYVALVAGLALAGVPLCRHAADRLGTHDHPSIVFDEVVGYLVTMVAAPQGWQAVVLGFLLFRLFDIWKPWPIRWLDRSVGGGLGIMLDDVAAGALGCAVLQVVATLWS